MITLNANVWLGTLTNLVAYAQVLDTIKSGSVSRLIASAEDISTPYGDGKVVRSANIPDVEDLDTANSSLLKYTEPDVREQYFPVSEYKVIPLSINHYLIRGAFTDEETTAEFIGYLLASMKASRDVFLYQSILKQYGVYAPAQATQKVEIELVNISSITSGDADKQMARTANANTIAKTLIKVLRNMEAPSSKYNDDGLLEIINGEDLKLILNSDFDVDLIVDTFSTLFAAGRITEEERWSETIAIPAEQFDNLSIDSENLIGWLGHRKKVQFGYFYEVSTSFFDASNLTQQYWLHFSVYFALVNSLPCVKFTAKYVNAPVPQIQTTAAGA